MVLACTCKHTYQDKVYGKGMRLFNVVTKGGHRCTVCGRQTEGASKKK